ncbi:hypothetical protein ABH927_004025 [Planotetraspora sp. GP83]
MAGGGRLTIRESVNRGEMEGALRPGWGILEWVRKPRLRLRPIN